MASRSFLATLATIGIAALLFVIDIFLPLGVAAGLPYVLVVLLSAWLPARRTPLYMALLCSLLTVAGGVFSPPGGVLWMGILNRLLGITMLWLTAVFIHRRRNTEERLRQVNRELDAFVHTVSHDLRSPLSPILGFTDLLREQYSHCLTEEGTAALDEIEGQGRRMLALLDDLLQLAMVGYLERPPAPVDAEKVLQQVIDGWREKALQAEADLRRVGSLPQAPIPESLLSQIFDNLVGNAVRYAGGGLIEIGGESLQGRVSYYVRDHGQGIAPEERERVFDPFCRGSAGRGIPGTGIGLATVRKIALQFGGRVWVEETPGGGSTFRVELAAPR